MERYVHIKTGRPFRNYFFTTTTGPVGLIQSRHTAGLWIHKTRQIAFTLVVDDFAVNYAVTENSHHLRNALLHSYNITTDWGGKVYSGMKLK